MATKTYLKSSVEVESVEGLVKAVINRFDKEVARKDVDQARHLIVLPPPVHWLQGDETTLAFLALVVPNFCLERTKSAE